MSSRRYTDRSRRLQGYDYAQPGAYFITINVYQSAHLFGRICDGVMYLNQYGRIVADEWMRTAGLRPNILLDEFVVMPDHMHGILIITDIDGKHHWRKWQPPPDIPVPRLQSTSRTVGAIIRGFKGSVTGQINRLRNTPRRKVWQRDFDDRIIRTPKALQRIRIYIRNNPKNWNK